MVKMYQLQLHKSLFRELFLLPGCDYHYMNYSPANYLCTDFVGHGQLPWVGNVLCLSRVSQQREAGTGTKWDYSPACCSTPVTCSLAKTALPLIFQPFLLLLKQPLLSHSDSTRYLYDQLGALAPILLALTAATPIYKGHLSDVDVRWSVRGWAATPGGHQHHKCIGILVQYLWHHPCEIGISILNIAWKTQKATIGGSNSAQCWPKVLHRYCLCCSVVDVVFVIILLWKHLDMSPFGEGVGTLDRGGAFIASEAPQSVHSCAEE